MSRRIAFAVLLGVAATLLGSRQINDDFKPVYVSADLAHPERFLADASLVGPSEFGLLEWRAPGALVVPGVVVRAGDRLKAQVLAECDQGVLAIRAGGGEAVSVPLGPGWQSVDVTMPAGGTGLRLDKRVPEPCPVHLSRLSVANFHGEMTGLFEAHLVRSRLARPALGWLRLLLLAIAPAVVVAVAGAWQRRVVLAPPRRAWRVAAGCALVPVAILVAFEAFGAIRHLWLVMPGRSFGVLFALPVAILLGVSAVKWAWREAPRLVWFVTGAAARMSQSWRDLSAGDDSEAQAGDAQPWRMPWRAASAKVAAGGNMHSEQDDVINGGGRAIAGRDAAARERARRCCRFGFVTVAALYLVTLVLLRPASPFEWDEVLFQHAELRYDVGLHHPHPPGYPAYVGAAKAVRWIVSDPLLALQLVSVLSAAVALVALWRMARRLGAPAPAATVGAAMLAVTPAFAFNANVGLSDVAGAAGAVLAVWAMVAAMETPALLPLASAVSALALAVRPQLAAAILPVGLWVVWGFLRRRRFKLLALGLVSGVAASLACWLPAVLTTGASRFWSATRLTEQWMAEVEHGYHLPAAPVHEIALYWFVRPFASGPAAAVFWGLVVWGCWEWWRRGQRVLLAVAGASGGAYLVISMFSLNFTTSVRYILPSLPFLAVIAGGTVLTPRRRVRVLAWTLCVAWCLGTVVWAAPVYRLRRQPAPVWAAMEWVRAHFRPDTTTVIFPGTFLPHVKYYLERDGFTIRKGESVPLCGSAVRGDGDVVVLLDHSLPGQQVAFSSSWSSEKLRVLTRDRYYEAAVVWMPVRPGPCVSEGWRTSPHGWALSGQGLIEIGEGESPGRVRVRAGAEPLVVRRAGFPPLTLPPTGEAVLPVFPGKAGAIGIGPAEAGRAAVVDTVELIPYRGDEAELADAFVIPQVAHTQGKGSSEWHSDVTVFNPLRRALPLRVSFFPAAASGGSVQSVELSLAGGEVVTSSDVLGGPRSPFGGSAGFLLIESPRGERHGEPGTFAAFSRTYDLKSGAAGLRVGEGLPAVPVAAALVRGREIHFSSLANDAGARASFGVASLGSAPVTLRVDVLDERGAWLASEEFVVPRMSSVQKRLATRFSRGSLRVRIIGGGSDTRLFPYVSMIDNATGTPDHRLPDEYAGSALPLPSRAGPATARKR